MFNASSNISFILFNSTNRNHGSSYILSFNSCIDSYIDLTLFDSFIFTLDNILSILFIKSILLFILSCVLLLLLSLRTDALFLYA